MSERITLQNLNALLGRMQRSIGDPAGPVWTPDTDGRNRARVGALMLEQGSKINGIGWKFVQIVNESGGQRTLIRGSTARELWDAAQAWLDGFDAAAKLARPAATAAIELAQAYLRHESNPAAIARTLSLHARRVLDAAQSHRV